MSRFLNKKGKQSYEKYRHRESKLSPEQRDNVSKTCLLMDKITEDKKAAAIEERKRFQDPALFA